MLEARRSDDPPSTFNVDPLTVFDRGPLTECEQFTHKISAKSKFVF